MFDQIVLSIRRGIRCNFVSIRAKTGTLYANLALRKKYAPTESIFELVFVHCKIVSDIAVQLAEKSGVNVNIKLVKAGCLLHDIGVYRLFDKNGVETDGLNILRTVLVERKFCKTKVS